MKYVCSVCRVDSVTLELEKKAQLEKMEKKQEKSLGDGNVMMTQTEKKILGCCAYVRYGRGVCSKLSNKLYSFEHITFHHL